MYVYLDTVEEVAEAIKTMKVRGAPLIGITAALGVALHAQKVKHLPREKWLAEIKWACETLRKTRPTAVNLFNALERVLAAASDGPERVLEVAKKIMREEEEACARMGNYGEQFIRDGDGVLTHCNTGSLATYGIGTALGVIRSAYSKGKRFRVFYTETRPRMQGSKLTGYELVKEGIPATLIADTAVGFAMSRGLITKVFLGADRIVRGGYIYNKIGTYQIAVLAKRHGVPFYVVAPTSTIDLKSKPEDVIIEHRNPNELLYIEGVRVAPEGVTALNPAFDETPPELVTAIITERGVAYPPFEDSLPRLVDD